MISFSFIPITMMISNVSASFFRPTDSEFTLTVPASDSKAQQDILFIKGGCDVDATKNPETKVRSMLWNYPSAGQVLAFYESESASSPYARIRIKETGYSIRLCNLAKSMEEQNYRLEVTQPSTMGVFLGPQSVVKLESSTNTKSSKNREMAKGVESLIDRKVKQIKKDVGVNDDEILYLNVNAGDNINI
jgi:hypothetical protein